MADNISLDQSDSYNANYSDYNRNRTLGTVSWEVYVAEGLVCTGIAVTVIALCVVFSEIKKNQFVPVYIINLLFSDLIQLCCLCVAFTTYNNGFLLPATAAISASVGFMVCISMERYLVVAKPMWYRFNRKTKTSVMVSLLVWVLSAVLSWSFLNGLAKTTVGVFLLIPLPLFLLFLVGTIKALSAAQSVPGDEKRRIVGLLVLVVLVYTLLFVPASILLICERGGGILSLFAIFGIVLSPLADAIMYVLLIKSTFDRLLAACFCCEMLKNEEQITMTETITSCDDTDQVCA